MDLGQNSLVSKAWLMAWFALLSAAAGVAQPQVGDPDPDFFSACVPAWVKFAGQDDLDSQAESMTIGPDGFIYFGGSTGLFRLEGGQTREWLPDPANPNAISGGAVTALLSDDTHIWLGNGLGLSRFHTDTEIFQRIPISDKYPSDYHVRALLQRDNELWAGTTSGGLFRLNLDDVSQVDHISLAQESDRPLVYSLQEFKDKIIVGTVEGLEAIDQDGTPRLINFGPDAIRNVETLGVGPQGNLWAGAETGLYKIESLSPLKFTRFTPDSLPNMPEGRIEALSFDPSGTLWMASRTGLSRWDLETPAAQRCRRSRFLTPDREISVAFVNASIEGRLFMGTRGALAKSARLDTDIRRIVPGETSYSNLSDESPFWSTLIASDGRLLIGTAAGLYRERRPGEDYFEAIEPERLSTHRVHSISEDSDGRIWIGTNKSMFVLEGDVLSLISLVSYEEGERRNERVYKIIEANGDIVAASPQGLFIVEPGTKRLKHFFRSVEDTQPAQNVPITDLAHGGVWHVVHYDGVLFATGSSKVYRIAPDAANETGYDVTHRLAGELQTARLYTAAITSTNRLLIGTDNGLIESDLNFENLTYVSTLNGARIGRVNNMLTGPDGRTWVASALLGVLSMAPDGSWASLSVEDGLHLPRVTQGAMSMSGAGEIVTATASGATVLPADIVNRLSRDRSFKWSIFESVRRQSISNGTRLQIGPSERDLSLTFSVAELIEDGRYGIQYAFGPDLSVENVTRIDLDERLYFRSLATGTYKFRGQLMTATGPIANPIEFEIEVMAVWWRRQEAFFLYLWILMILGSLIFFRRARMIEMRYKLIADERKRIAQDLHDTSLQDILGAKVFGQALVEAQSDPGNQQLAARVVGLLDTATRSVRKSVSEFSEMAEVRKLSEAIKGCEAPAKYGQDIPVRVNEHGTQWDMTPQRRFFLSRIVQEAINNACKHARPNAIWIDMHWTWNRLQISVVDDGTGFDPESESSKKGFGLGAMQRMAKAAKSTITLNSSESKGTEVLLSIPRFYL